MIVVTAMLAASGCGDESQSASVDCENYEFPSVLWKATNTREESAEELRIRRQAADAVVACRLLDGEPASQVRRILGKPHRRDTQGWIYVVGEERGPFVVDDEKLYVLLKNDRVTGAQLGDG